ncbi:hypothetical protein Cal6303_0017 [Calothrix sp. PCC 6303]|nr:hypothetical protein Cal6303_0017 [Calothrix sp. PCC 6303]
MKLQRPILVGGLGLSFVLWLFSSLQDSLVQVGEVSLLSLIIVGGGLWFLKQNRVPTTIESVENLPRDRATVVSEISQAEVVVNCLANEAENHPLLTNLRQQVSNLETEIDRNEIKLAVTGGKSTGKTTLIQTLAANWQPGINQAVSFEETAPLFIQDATNLKGIFASNDYVLFLVNGDITSSEYQFLQQLKTNNHRTTLVFNKQDQYSPDERTSIFLSLQQRMSGNVITTSAAPLPIKVRQHSDDGSFQEYLEQPAPDTEKLQQHLLDVLTQQGQQLVWATTVRKARLLKFEAKNSLNTLRKERATPITEQYQWIAAAAAFANPVPALDLLATAAINAQMVMDLGNIYQQKFSLEQAKTVAAEMGGLMLKLGLVELSTKAIGIVLKSNAVTFAVGGVIQGVSAAYLTRIAGLALVEYFQAQEIAIDTGNALNLDKLRQTLQNVFQQNQQISYLQGFIQQGVKRLLPETEITLDHTPA